MSFEENREKNTTTVMSWAADHFIEKKIIIETTGMSSSMMPLIRPGEKVTVAFCQHCLLRSGDVVVFKSGDKLIAHRLVFKKNFVAVTKGDNNPDCDPPISVFDIVGVVSGKSSKRALWFYFFRNKLRKIRFLRFLLRPLKRFFHF